MSSSCLVIASWNVNSVRARLDQVLAFAEGWQVDVLALQEIRCTADAFPRRAFEQVGFVHQAIHGQKNHHGVAIVSKLPLKDVWRRDFCNLGDARHVAATIAGHDVEVHSLYVPAGGDVPDPELNPRFAHKLAFLEEMRAWLAGSRDARGPARLLMGDFNIAPLACDVWDTKKLARTITHTPTERAALTGILETSGMIDVVRARFAPPAPVFTWWSYRAGAHWRHHDRGRRLDHAWAHPRLAALVEDVAIASETRGWPRPPDHVPLVVRLREPEDENKQTFPTRPPPPPRDAD